MNSVVSKSALLFALILGAFLGIISVIPQLIGICLFALSFLCAPIIIIYMKNKEKHLGIISTENGAKLGAIIGAASTIGFFVTFSPLVCIVKLIFRSYYAYALPDTLKEALWLFFIIVGMVALIFAATNSATGMGCAWLYSTFEKQPEEPEAHLDIKIED